MQKHQPIEWPLTRHRSQSRDLMRCMTRLSLDLFLFAAAKTDENRAARQVAFIFQLIKKQFRPPAWWQGGRGFCIHQRVPSKRAGL